MREFWLPYGDTELPALIENEALCKILSIKNLDERSTVQVNLLLKDYIEKLFSEEKIEETVLIAPKETIQTNLINELISIVKEELFKKGLKKENVNTVYFSSFEELFSRESVINEETIDETYNSLNAKASFIGETKSGIKFFLNDAIKKANTKILIGEAYSSFLFNFLNPYIQAVFGLTNKETITEILKFIILNIDSFYNEAYNTEKLIKEFKSVFSVDLALTLIPNVKGEPATILLGDLNEVLEKEKEFINEYLKVKVEGKPGLIIGSAGGNFFDLNFLKAFPGLKSLSNIIEDEGTIVYLAECRNGLGFNPKFKKIEEKNDAITIFNYLIQKILVKILTKTKIYLVSSLPNYYTRELLGFKPYETLNSALKNVKLNFKNEKNILIVPYASYTVLELKNNA
ncbi:MAG: hypothetical protein QXR82_00520 [Candidatus Bathyarchaeia archaeon]|nr:hypothetical protein [Candidatus Bathyarchaeota archaeon]